MIDKYVNNNQTSLEISKLVGCEQGTVIRYLRKFSLIKRPQQISPGDIFNSLQTISSNRLTLPYETGEAWLCRCLLCNNEITVYSWLLRNGDRKDCGKHCIKEENSGWTGYKDISGTFWRRAEKGALSRNLSFNITKELVWETYEKQNKKCALTGIDISFYHHKKKRIYATASIDRINSKIGYEIDNIWILHKDVNIMKWDFDVNYFIDICRQISTNIGDRKL